MAGLEIRLGASPLGVRIPRPPPLFQPPLRVTTGRLPCGPRCSRPVARMRNRYSRRTSRGTCPSGRATPINHLDEKRANEGRIRKRDLGGARPEAVADLGWAATVPGPVAFAAVGVDGQHFDSDVGRVIDEVELAFQR